jgi:hypothetical protein
MVVSSEKKTSRLKFAVAAGEINRISTASIVILCYMPAGYQDHHVM